jgi:hypothetical protein
MQTNHTLGEAIMLVEYLEGGITTMAINRNNNWSEPNRTYGSTVAQSNPYAPTIGIEGLIPHKRGNEQEVLSMPLTRPQRFIYFLIDGRRTISDLARCTRKNMQEVEWILSELQEQNLIFI